MHLNSSGLYLLLLDQLDTSLVLLVLSVTKCLAAFILTNPCNLLAFPLPSSTAATYAFPFDPSVRSFATPRIYRAKREHIRAEKSVAVR